MKFKLSLKANTQIDKMKQTRSTSLMIISAAAVVAVFCLVASKGLISEAAHQRRIISGRNTAITQIKNDIAAINTLSSQYQAFNTAATNIIGGSSTGTGANDGTNPQIVLDALPSQYDFPGLTASIEKLIANRRVALDSITGVDDESANVPNAVPNPRPITMTFSFSASSSYKGIKLLFDDFQKSIRPLHVTTLQLVGNDSQMSVNATINTYFQPAKSLNITNKVVQ